MFPLPCLDSSIVLHFIMPLKVALSCKPIFLVPWSKFHTSTLEEVGAAFPEWACVRNEKHVVQFEVICNYIKKKKMHCDVSSCCNIEMWEDSLNLGSFTGWGCFWREHNHFICLFVMELLCELFVIGGVQDLKWQYFCPLYLNILMHDKLMDATDTSFLVDLEQLLSEVPCRYLSLQSKDTACAKALLYSL
jgi:hypothetical protein